MGKMKIDRLDSMALSLPPDRRSAGVRVATIHDVAASFPRVGEVGWVFSLRRRTEFIG